MYSILAARVSVGPAPDTVASQPVGPNRSRRSKPKGPPQRLIVGSVVLLRMAVTRVGDPADRFALGCERAALMNWLGSATVAGGPGYGGQPLAADADGWRCAIDLLRVSHWHDEGLHGARVARMSGLCRWRSWPIARQPVKAFRRSDYRRVTRGGGPPPADCPSPLLSAAFLPDPQVVHRDAKLN